MSAPKPLAQRVRDSQRRAKAAGGRRMPDGYLTPQGAADLDTLYAAGHGASRRAVVERALHEAVQRMQAS